MSEPTLADAMESGFTEIGRQTYGALYQWEKGNPKPTACCAAGAVLVSLWFNIYGPEKGAYPVDGWVAVLEKHYRIGQEVVHPEQNAVLPPYNLGSTITSLNDVWMWPIPKIVAWLRSEAEAGRIDIRHRKDIANG